MALTLFAVQNAKPKEKPYKLSDGEGLHLLVQTNGSKLWRFRYQFGGKEKMLSLGTFPEISLASAREKRIEARSLVAAGTDPSQQRKADKLASEVSAANTFGVIAEEYLQSLRDKGRAEITVEKNAWLLRELAKPLTDRPITEITPAEILAVLKGIEKTGRRETAGRLRRAIGSVFRFAIANLKATTDPTYPLRGALLPPIVKNRAAITDERKLGALMVGIDEYDGYASVRNSLLFVALTMARPGEVRLMKRSEVNWLKATWSIPAERMKMRRPHDVPLSRQALEVLREIWGASEEDGLVFPSIRSAHRPLSDMAMNAALRRMGIGQEEHCAHGFRSSASTILRERGYQDHVIETALAHLDPNEVRRAYNRAKYWPERVKMLQDWADFLDSFRRDATTRVA